MVAAYSRGADRPAMVNSLHRNHGRACAGARPAGWAVAGPRQERRPEAAAAARTAPGRGVSNS